MARVAAIGIQDFSVLIEKNCFYVDKTCFIKEWWENEDTVTLITRPRRFGKTLMMSMLYHYFSVSQAGRGELFARLNIWKEKRYQKLQGTYPVIFLSFANVKSDNFKETYYDICRLIMREYRRYVYVLEDDHFLEADRRQYYRIMEGDANPVDIRASLNLLSEYLYHYYDKKVIILLDEYDAPMQEAYVNGYWKELVDFMRGLMNATFKTNFYLERAVMTGITRVSRESVFSDLNNPTVVTTTTRLYETAFGFTEDEVFHALEEYGLQDEKEGVKQWYDGFRFGDCDHIYNPWSVIHFLRFKEYSAYWANTSSNKLIGNLIQKGSQNVKIVMEDLMKGRPFHTILDEQIVFEQLGQSEHAIWSLLLAGGYLKVTDCKRDKRNKKEYTLDIVNLEVRQMFEDMFSNWFSVCRTAYNDFIKALLANDVKMMNIYMNKVALHVTGSFDSGSKPSEKTEPERFYHGLVLGFMIDLADRYVLTSNRESGFGRYDVLLEPKSYQDDGIILEFKVYDREEESGLSATADAALRQVIDKKYDTVLKCSKDKIRIYGFAFKGKKVLIDGGYIQEVETRFVNG